MIDKIVNIVALIFIYILGAWSGIIVMALVNAGKDWDDLEDEFHKPDEAEDEDELP